MARFAVDSFPHCAFLTVAGGTAIFTGLGSPMTHAMGIGMSGSVNEEELERLERFYSERRSSCLIDLCPMAHDSVIAFVQNRPYRVIEFNNVLARPIRPDEVFEADEAVRSVEEQEKALWARTICEGFSEYMPVSEEQAALMSIISKETFCLLGTDSGGRAVGGAGFAIQDRTALLFGDAVLPIFRRIGWQTRFIRRRLALAQRNGCDLAVASVLPASGSHRNYERAGFELIYMRVNLSREFAGI
ncbi:MAG: GNAT family N-acetyltransferase [Bryobacteraceae bacterium]